MINPEIFDGPNEPDGFKPAKYPFSVNRAKTDPAGDITVTIGYRPGDPRIHIVESGDEYQMTSYFVLARPLEGLSLENLHTACHKNMSVGERRAVFDMWNLVQNAPQAQE